MRDNETEKVTCTNHQSDPYHAIDVRRSEELMWPPTFHRGERRQHDS